MQKDKMLGVGVSVLTLGLLAAVLLRPVKVNVVVNVPEMKLNGNANALGGSFIASPSGFTDLEVTNDLVVDGAMVWRDVDVTSTSTVQRWQDIGLIGVGSSTYYSKQNTLPGLTYVRALLQEVGVASATTRFFLGTSTVALAPDFNASAASIARGIINNAQIATSSVNGSVDSVFEITKSLKLGSEGSLSASSTWTLVPQGSYLVGYMTTGGSNAIQGSSATSAAGRGFSLDSFVLLEYMRVATGTHLVQ